MSTKVNTIYNIIGSASALAISMLCIPVLIREIGEIRFGILSLATLLLGYLGLFDFGLSRATAQRMAQISDGDKAEQSNVFWTALTTNLIIGILGGILTIPIIYYVISNIHIAEESIRVEALDSLVWISLSVPMATMTGVLTGALEGRGKFLHTNAVSVVNIAMLQTLPIIVAVFNGPDLRFILPSILLAKAVSLLMLFIVCRNIIYKNHQFEFSRERAIKLLKYGGWITTSSVISPMMVVTDRFLIGATIGAREVTQYTIPFQLAERMAVIPGALSAAMFPKFANTNEDESKIYADRAIRVLSIVMTPLAILMIILIQPFLNLWIGRELAEASGGLSIILIMGYWINGFARVSLARLQASGRPDIAAKCHMVEVLPYLVALYFLLKHYGIMGAAIAFAFRTFADSLLLFWYAGILHEAFKILHVPALIIALTASLVYAENSITIVNHKYIFLIFSISVTWMAIEIRKIAKEKTFK
jgi:O-antigen/teichoic acid export membrane protein